MHQGQHTPAAPAKAAAAGLPTACCMIAGSAVVSCHQDADALVLAAAAAVPHCAVFLPIA